MRIAQIVASLEPRHGGPSISVPKLANAMVEFESDIELLTTGPDVGDRVVAGLCPQKTFDRGMPEWICPSKGLAQYLEHLEVDILHSHGLWLRPLHYANQRAAKLAIPHVISPRGMLSPWAWKSKRWKKYCANKIIHPGALSGARGWHATSPQEADDIRHRGFNQPICVAPNGVDLPTQQDTKRATDFWKNACPDAWNRPTALFYSRFHHKKRVLELIDVWIDHAPKEWLLLMVGVPQEYSIDQLQAYVLRNSCSGRILIFDGTGTPPPYVAGSIFLLPSHSENFGLVVAEAMSYGVPVLVTDTTPWEAVNQTDSGWCGPWAHFPQAMKAALELGEKTLRARGEQAKEWVVREYSWRKSAQSLIEFYNSLK